MLEHRLCLIEQTAVFEGGDEVADRFTFDADGGGEDVIADCEHAGDDDHTPAVEEGWERGAEFTNVDDDARRFSGSSQAATTSNTGVDCAEELFLGICRSGAVESEGNRHVLSFVRKMVCEKT